LILRATDGYSLGACLFEPVSAVAGTLVIHGATATPQRYYRRFAEFLAKRGVRVVTYDYRGIGQSRPASLRGYRATMTEWADVDARSVHWHVRARYGAQPVAILGHSFGGQLVGLIDEAREACGAIFVGAQLGYYGYWRGLQRIKMGMIVRAVIPAVSAAAGYLPGRMGIGEDLPRGVAEEWARWCSHPDYLISDHPDAQERFARFDRPIAFYSFTDDAYAPRSSVDALIRRLSSAVIDHRRLRPSDLGVGSVGHFGFFRPPFRDTMWMDVLDFLRDVFAGTTPKPARAARPACEVSEEEVLADLHVAGGR
jgi:predicted alpha/beta hydrolase